MNDTHKLLLAFIEASGFDVEENVITETHEISYAQLHGMPQAEKNKYTDGSAGGMVSKKARTAHYKVTKKGE